jgi:hypothetical protein
MKYLNALASIGAALVIAGMGITGLIDHDMMIFLTIVLACCTPAAGVRRCGARRA